MAKGQKFKCSPTPHPTQSSGPMPNRGQGPRTPGHGASTAPLSPGPPPQGPTCRERGVRPLQQSAGTGAGWTAGSQVQTETPIREEPAVPWDALGAQMCSMGLQLPSYQSLLEMKRPQCPRPPNPHEPPEMGRHLEAQNPALPCSRKTHQPEHGGNGQERPQGALAFLWGTVLPAAPRLTPPTLRSRLRWPRSGRSHAGGLQVA